MSVLGFITVLWPTAASRTDITLQISIAESMTGAVFGEELIGTTGTKNEYARALRAMHNMALTDNSASSGYIGGIVKSEKTGELSKDYHIDSNIISQFPDLAQTTWGIMLIGLIKGNVITPMIATPCLP
jgi:hypothetical protein